VAVALRHVNEPPPSLRERRADVSPRLEAAVERALAKDPAHRVPSMAAFAKELRACLVEPEGQAPPQVFEDDAGATLITRPAPRPAPVRRRRSRRRPFVWALLALVAAGAAFVAVFFVAGAGHDHGGSGGGGTTAGTGVVLRGVGDYYENLAGSPDTHADSASAATDGDPGTSWFTQIYGSPDFGGLMTALGLVVDSGRSTTLSQVTVRTPSPGFVARIEVGHSAQGPFTADSSSQTVQASTTFSLDGKSGRYYVVLLTQLPPGNKAEISEVTAATS
jgi:hypothetical protein